MRILVYTELSQAIEERSLVMLAPIGLREVPKTVLDSTRWTELRAFASSDLMALTLINAPYPDPDNPTDFFWGRDSTFDDALRCYDIGRDLLCQCRRLLIERKLVATGIKPNGTRETINPTDWANLWPMFATNRATGPNQAFDDVEIHESTALETLDEKMLLDCISWLRAQSTAAPKEKKEWLFHLARLELGANLTHAMFNAAYKAVLAHARGRPKN
jgi:hypothetical protein